ncbi:RNA-guided endonuclease InsQ/TnpB family protein [Natronorubrum halophilum]|uniref:RNA-guided endonuclease InsQ/TnpB family protein n=1 Tax=Natronorubrum halophilum TaxID=1702106 RepID=UPI0010C1EC11|nr:RNA-guided endonuclease TnpB family protein [Natronorubrum halophilum]
MGQNESEQQPLSEFTSGTTTETVVQTVILNLETSDRKADKMRTIVDEFQAMCKYLSTMIPSVPEEEWNARNPTLDRMVKAEFSDKRTVSAKVRQKAVQHVVAAFTSWRERGKHQNDDRPTLGNGDFFQADNQMVELSKNDRGYGIRINAIPYETEWFHIDASPYSRDYLKRICDGDATYGTAEFRLGADDDVHCHLPVKWDIEVYEPADVTTSVGVDIGETVVYAAAVVSGDDVNQVEIKSGREFRHHRELLDQKRSRLSEQGDLRGVRQCRGERERYTEHVLDTASREIVELADIHRPAVIVLEDLTNYRETAEDPIHDWPYSMLQEKIAYKATAAGIPVETVDPRDTSITCRKCGQTNRDYREGTGFHCTRCGYTVHADVNAAINIAHRYD